MHSIAIINPVAGGALASRRWPALRAELARHVDDEGIWRTTAPGDAEALAARACREGVERIIVCGGDGTLNEIVNGLFADPTLDVASRPELVFYGHGSGGDFVRSLPCGGTDYEAVLAHGVRRAIDVGRISLADGSHRYFANVSSFGVSGVIAERINRTRKRLGGRAAFYVGTLQGLFGWRNRTIRITAPGYERTLQVTAVAVANARYFGGGMQIAPGAELADGALDVVVVKGAGAGTFLRHAPSLYRGTHLGLPFIEFFRTSWLEAEVVDGGPPVSIETDGEVAGNLRVRYDLLPAALTVRTLG